MRVKVSAEVDIDVSDLNPRFVNIEEFAKSEARAMMISEPEYYEFSYEIIRDENT